MTPRPAALPRRPLTIGELLDAAVQLVRSRALIIFPLAAAFAILEQAILFPLRRWLGVDFLDGFQGEFWDTVGALWLVATIGFGLEAFIITTLGAWTGRAAAEDLVGAEPSGARLLRPRWREVGSLSIAAPVTAVLSTLGGLLGPLWVLGYGLFGLAGAAIGMERRGPFGALGRAAGLTFRNGMRVTWVRVLGYSAWLVLRLGFFVGVAALFDYIPLDAVGRFWVTTAGFVVANSAAYLFLAALDAVTLAETRFRNEGLDIWLSRAERHAPLTPQALAVSR